MLPVVLGLCSWWEDRRIEGRDIARLAPFFGISVAASVWTIWEQQFHSGAIGADWALTWPQRFIVAGRDLWFYLGKLAWPHPLVFIYPLWKIDASQPLAYLPLLAAGGALYVLWSRRNGWGRSPLFAFAYFAVSLFPLLGFFNVYYFRFSYVADHFQYLASMGPLALAGAGLARLPAWLAQGRR